MTVGELRNGHGVPVSRHRCDYLWGVLHRHTSNGPEGDYHISVGDIKHAAAALGKEWE